MDRPMSDREPDLWHQFLMPPDMAMRVYLRSTAESSGRAPIVTMVGPDQRSRIALLGGVDPATEPDLNTALSVTRSSDGSPWEEVLLSSWINAQEGDGPWVEAVAVFAVNRAGAWYRAICFDPFGSSSPAKVRWTGAESLATPVLDPDGHDLAAEHPLPLLRRHLNASWSAS